jgi:O-antigen/teichoic acid export membrane protein
MIRFGIRSDRSKNIISHIGWSLVYKVGVIIANFLLVPLTIGYLNAINYGIWLALSSFITWFAFFDIGLGNGLRNKFAEARVSGNIDKAHHYVSTAYFSIGFISLSLIISFLFVNYFIEWTSVFNTSHSLRNELRILLPVTFSFFALQLVLKLIINIYQASQDHSINDKIQFFGQLTSLVIIWILTKTSYSSLLLFGIIFSALPVLILIGLNIFAFKTKFILYKPNIRKWSSSYLKDITGLGFNFFITKIGALVLLSTDSFIIIQLYGPAEVVPYNLAYKYFSILLILYALILNPYWSSFTDAYTRNDIQWIKTSVKTIQKMWFMVPIGLTVMVLMANKFYYLWVGDQVKIPLSLSLSMALFVLFHTFNQIYNQFINGVGKIKMHVFISIIIIIINIPMSIFFAKNLGLNVSGIILASCVCLLFKIVILPIQYHKIINNKAKGIWNS